VEVHIESENMNEDDDFDKLIDGIKNVDDEPDLSASESAEEAERKGLRSKMRVMPH